METVQSQDGTAIAFERSGAGPPLVLVHGTSADHTRWAVVLPALERTFTVYAVDRRGRGGSGDAPDYSIEREFEDIAAVVDSIGEPVNLLGHSYGGECSLGAAILTKNVRRLVLYEPDALQPGEPWASPELMRKLQTLLSSGDREGVVSLFFQEVVGGSPHEIEILRSAPSWAGRVAAAHTIPREIEAADHYVLDLQRLTAVTAPTLFLVGGDSSTALKAGTEILHAALANSRIVVMPGQQHIAMNTAPELFVREVSAFCRGP
jgi:pimeloyl-ACP methyl ester carboxylesterase